jgi:hypothetical protein
MDSELIERLLEQRETTKYEVAAAGIADNQRIAALEKKVAELDAECDRRVKAYKIAHDQAMKNGEEACRAKAEVARLREAGRHIMPYLTFTISGESPVITPLCRARSQSFAPLLEKSHDRHSADAG